MTNDREGTEQEESVVEATPAEAPTAEPRRRGGGFAAGVFLGLLTGAGLATLFTPVSGQEVRQRTAERAPELWRRREELALGAAQTARSRMHEAMEAGREAAHEAEEESRRRFERLTGRNPVEG